MPNKVKLTHRTFFRTLLIVFGVVVVSLGVFIWVAAGYLVSPPRRALQDYHRDWLEHAAVHGMLVDQYGALDGVVRG